MRLMSLHYMLVQVVSCQLPPTQAIPKDRVERVVNEKLQQLGLVEFENKRAGALSGGNKRKLSVAIALIGNPPLLFLDEPSTGMWSMGSV